MTITRNNPNCIHLGGPVVYVNDLAASEAITPGMLVEMFNNAGVTRLRKNTQTGLAGSTYAVEQSMLNLDVDDAYAANDLVEAVVGSPGTTIWAWVASGANIAFGDLLSNAGNGKLKAVNGVAVASALENKNNSAGPGDARIRVECV